MTTKIGENSASFSNGSKAVVASFDDGSTQMTITPATDAQGNAIMPPGYNSSDPHWQDATIAASTPYVAPPAD